MAKVNYDLNHARPIAGYGVQSQLAGGMSKHTGAGNTGAKFKGKPAKPKGGGKRWGKGVPAKSPTPARLQPKRKQRRRVAKPFRCDLVGCEGRRFKAAYDLAKHRRDKHDDIGAGDWCGTGR